MTARDDSLHTLAQWIDEAQRITILTGAGMSTESGIPDFRSTAGIWTKDRSREELMSLTYLRHHPQDFWAAYKEIFQLKLQSNYKPNQGHLALKRLEDLGKKVTIVTQNVDELHQQAGSTVVYEVHGTIKLAHCPTCGTEYNLDYINSHSLPRCKKVKGNGEECHTILHPGVVLFEDQVRNLHESVQATCEADLFLVLGSSLQVGPVNQLPMIAQDQPQTRKVLMNRERTILDHCFDLIILGEIGATLEEVLSQRHTERGSGKRWRTCKLD